MPAITPAAWIDLHAHLDGIENAGLALILEEAGRANVSTILIAATNLASAAAVARQCSDFPALFGAVGISPFDVKGIQDGWEQKLKAFSQNPRIIAIGEIGLDDSNPRYPSIVSQLPVFEKQLAIAGEYDLPVIVHSRGAENRVAEICNRLGVTKAVFHCFTGDRETLIKILDYGYYVSFSGIVTFSGSVRDLVPIVPLERIFIETDTPYLAPVPHRGKPNCPAWVGLTGDKVAECKGVTIEVLQKAIEENFERLFRVKANT
jgi:TatD DNase family protein